MSEGNELSQSLEKELNELRIEKKIMELLEPMSEMITQTHERVLLIDQKVEIHNSYESRIGGLEKNQWKIMGIYTGILSVLAMIIFVLTKL